MDATAICKYCHKRFLTQSEAIGHVVHIHTERKIAITSLRSCGKVKTRSFNISGEDIGQDESKISYNEESGLIQVLTKDTTESPVQKIKRINTPTKTVHKQLFKDNGQLEAKESDIEDENINWWYASMGSSSSTNIQPIGNGTKTIQNRKYKDDGDKHTLCTRHSNTVTHFNEKTEQLFCLTCYQDYKRKHTLSETAHVLEITEFLKTIQFKQTELQTLEKLRSSQYTTEQRLLQVTQIKSKLENKRSQFLDEIKLFVNTVIDLIKHLEEEICRETNSTLHTVVNELEDRHSRFETELKTVSTFKNEIETSKQTGSNVARVSAVIRCKNFLTKTRNLKDKITDYEPILKLNKHISLNDMIGKKGDKKKVSLGYVTCNSRIDSVAYDTLSDISEDASDDTTYTKRSTTQQTNSTSGANSSQLNTGDIGDNSVINKTPTNTNNFQYRNSVVEVVRDKSRSGVHRDNTNHVHETDNYPFDSEDKSKHYADSSDVGELHIPNTNERLTQVQDMFYESVNRHQLLRDYALSKNIPRRISYSGTPNRKTPTPRRSSQSIVSPGNITSPYFISPRPKQNLESMERRIAMKFREIKLPRDENIANITDTTQLGDGNMVLCDQKNEKLILMDKQFDIKSEIKLSGHPHNVANVPGTTKKIAVTIPDENVIKVVEVIDNSFDERVEVIKLQSKPKCRGIEYVDGNLIYTTRNDVAVLRKDDMTRTWKFKYAFRDPVSLCADKRNDVIYVSCLGLKSFGEVVKMHYKDEKIDFVISCNEIHHPVCSTSDREGFIYICDVDPPSVHQVTPDGKYCRRLLSDSQGKFQHVNFLEGTDMFIATENDSDTVSIYEMT